MSIKFNYNYPQVARDAGFKMRKYSDGPMDWRVMGSIEIERLLREQDFHKLDCSIEHLCEAPLGSILETSILDQTIAKYFLLSQFAIQYLMFCRTFLDESVQELREAHSESQLEIATLRKNYSESKNEVLQLTKKIQEIETIREVVYPCHLCTKNFVSNESLNIHIGRKHSSSGGRTVNLDKTVNSPGGQSREREKDLTLINTIKLELEIKQLKERLNTAEKDIRERALLNSRRTTPRVNVKMLTKEIGIQSNLDEEKEKDDSLALDNLLQNKQTETLQMLMEKIHDFEMWRNKLRKDYERFMVDINKKFELLSETLDQTNSNAKEIELSLNNNNGRTASPSVEDLERLLIEKVAEIGKASAKKLEEVVQHMEESYEKKLKDLEREIKNKNFQIPTPNDQNEQIVKTVNVAKNKEVNNKISSSTFIVDSFDLGPEKYTTNEKNNIQIKDKELDVEGECEIEDAVECESEGEGGEDILTVSFESNKTFEVKQEDKDDKKQEQDTASVSINSETEHDLKNEIIDDGSDIPSDSELSGQESTPKNFQVNSMENTKEEIGIDTSSNFTEVLKPFTRRDAKRLANKELAKHGISTKNKAISTTMMKRIYAQLADRRHLLKKKYPQIYATRNKIKKFVDKLCSSQLPENAEHMLKGMHTYQPIASLERRNNKLQLHNTLSKNLELTLLNTSTPRSLIVNKSNLPIKNNLEQLLSEPLDERPSTSAAARRTRSPHQPMTRMKPIPRKRVMFTDVLSR